MSSARLRRAAALLPLLSFAAPAIAQQSLDPIVVTATRQETRASDLLADVTVIDRAEIERHAGSTIADLLSEQPGMQFSRNGGPGASASLYMRGANPAQTKVLVDGISINSMDSSGSPLAGIPLSSIDRIEIVRGPASTLYGADAIGGVIQIFTRKGEPGLKADAFAGYGTQDTFQANAGVSAGDEQWRLRVEGNRQSTHGISSKAHASNRDADADGYYSTGGSASLSVLPAQGHEVGMIYRKTEGRSYYDGFGTGTFNAYGDFSNSQWQLFSRNRLASFWNSTLQYGQANDRRKDYSTPLGATFLATENRQLSWQNDIDLPLGRLLAAVERQEQQGSADASQAFAAGSTIANNSALLGWTASLGRHRWQLNGRRDDHSSFGGKSTYSASYGYQITPSLRAQVGYGTAFKAPTIYQLYTPLYGNAELRPETARNRELGLVWEDGTQTASVIYYRNSVRDMIDWVLTDPVNFAGHYENVARATLEGVTLSYTGRFGDWRVRGTYDWLNAIDDDTGMRLARRARNKAVAGVSRVWGAFEAGAEIVAVGSRFNGEGETTRLGGYSLVNLTARYAVTKALSVEGRIDNVMDKNYELAQGYGTPGIAAFVGVRYAPR